MCVRVMRNVLSTHRIKLVGVMWRVLHGPKAVQCSISYNVPAACRAVVLVTLAAFITLTFSIRRLISTEAMVEFAVSTSCTYAALESGHNRSHQKAVSNRGDG